MCATAFPDTRNVPQKDRHECGKKRQRDRTMAFKNACHPWIVVGLGLPRERTNFLDHNNSPKRALGRLHSLVQASRLPFKMKEENLSLETVWKRQKTDEEERKVSAAKKPLREGIAKSSPRPRLSRKRDHG